MGKAFQWSGQVAALVNPCRLSNCNQRHILRDRRPGATACLQLAGRWGQRGGKIFCTGPTRAAKVGKKISITGTRSPANQPRKVPFHMYYLSLHLRSVNSQQGPPFSIVSLIATHSNACLQKQMGENVCNKTKNFK